MKAWRQANPLRAVWRQHKDKAKARGIPVLWSFDEFRAFCDSTSYLSKRKEGFTIERKDCLQGYSAGNCVLLIGSENFRKGATQDKWKHKQARGKWVDPAPDDGSF